MLHRELLELVENEIAGMDRNHLERSRILLQSDLWLAGIRLDDREKMEPDRIEAMEAERERIKRAIEMIDRSFQKSGKA